ncbi:MAG: formyltransferase family protein [archaeon]
MAGPIYIYHGPRRDFNWVGFGSGSGTNLAALALNIKKPMAVFSDDPNAGFLNPELRPELKGVEQIVEYGYEHCGSWKAAKGDTQKEAAYFEKSEAFNRLILERLRQLESKKQKRINLIVLGGYMRLVRDPLLEEFTDRIINVHPSCLPYNPRVKGKRDLIGENAVYEAIKRKQWVTRSSVIIVDEGEDHGEILAQGPRVPVWEEIRQPEFKEADEEFIRKYAKVHQERQKEISDWPAFVWTLKAIADSKLAIHQFRDIHNEWRIVYHNQSGNLPYTGFDTPYKEIKLAA